MCMYAGMDMTRCRFGVCGLEKSGAVHSLYDTVMTVSDKEDLCACKYVHVCMCVFVQLCAFVSVQLSLTDIGK